MLKVSSGNKRHTKRPFLKTEWWVSTASVNLEGQNLNRSQRASVKQQQTDWPRLRCCDGSEQMVMGTLEVSIKVGMWAVFFTDDCYDTIWATNYLCLTSASQVYGTSGHYLYRHGDKTKINLFFSGYFFRSLWVCVCVKPAHHYRIVVAFLTLDFWFYFI